MTCCSNEELDDFYETMKKERDASKFENTLLTTNLVIDRPVVFAQPWPTFPLSSTGFSSTWTTTSSNTTPISQLSSSRCQRSPPVSSRSPSLKYESKYLISCLGHWRIKTHSCRWKPSLKALPSQRQYELWPSKPVRELDWRDLSSFKLNLKAFFFWLCTYHLYQFLWGF